MSSVSTKKVKQPKTYCFIDASNLFYGGKKSLGWSVDYKKLAEYLKKKYGARNLYYFGGIMTDNFPHDYLSNETVDLRKLVRHLKANKSKYSPRSKRSQQLEKYIARAKFYKKLQDFGYKLILRPAKVYKQPDGSKRIKANCDIEMAMTIIKDMNKYDRALVLTSDGDFLPVLKLVRHAKKTVTVLARGVRTARELKQFAGSDFRDFVTIRKYIEKTK